MKVWENSKKLWEHEPYISSSPKLPLVFVLQSLLICPLCIIYVSEPASAQTEQFLFIHIFRVIANYMMWHVVLRFSSHLSFKFREVFKEYRQAITGTTAEDPRWQDCLSAVDGSFGMPFGLLFVDETFEGESKKSVGNRHWSKIPLVTRSIVLSKIPSGEVDKIKGGEGAGRRRGLAYKKEKLISGILQYPFQSSSGHFKPSLKRPLHGKLVLENLS